MELTLTQASQENATLVGWLSSQLAIKPRLQHGAPNDDIMLAVQAIAADPVSVSRGEFLSRILRLPDVWRNALLEYVQGVKPYDRLGFVCHSTIQNQGKTSVQIVAAVTQVPMRDPGTGMPDDRWENVATRLVLEPGEDIELPSDRAVNALWKHSRNAMNPHRWQVEASSRVGRYIVEVAYRAEWQERDTGIHRRAKGFDPQWRMERLSSMESVVEDAKKLKTKDGSAALKMLRGANAWWPRPASFDSLMDKLEQDEAQAAAEYAATMPRTEPRTIPPIPQIGG